MAMDKEKLDKAIEVLRDGDWYSELPPEYTAYSQKAVELEEALITAIDAMEAIKDLGEFIDEYERR